MFHLEKGINYPVALSPLYYVLYLLRLRYLERYVLFVVFVSAGNQYSSSPACVALVNGARDTHKHTHTRGGTIRNMRSHRREEGECARWGRNILRGRKFDANPFKTLWQEKVRGDFLGQVFCKLNSGNCLRMQHEQFGPGGRFSRRRSKFYIVLELTTYVLHGEEETPLVALFST